MKEQFTTFFDTPQRKDQFRIGLCVDCNPAALTVDVLIEGTGTIYGIPIINIYGPSHHKDLTWLNTMRGATVLLIQTGAQYLALGTIPTQVTDSGEDSPAGAVPGYGGGDEKTYGSGVYRNFNPGRPKDIIPGDKVLRCDDGAELGLLRGGIARLKASSLAQIILGKIRDFVRVVARRLEIFTDFGHVIFSHEDGKVGMHLAGGADYAAEAHPGKSDFTVQVWAGNCPGGDAERFRIQVNAPGGGDAVTMAFDTDGNILIECAGSETTSIQQDKTESVQGNLDCSVGGDKSETVMGTSSETVTGDKTIASGSNVTIAAAGMVTISAPSVNISGVMSIPQGSGTATFTKPILFKSSVQASGGVSIGGALSVGGASTFTGLATFDGGTVGDQT